MTNNLIYWKKYSSIKYFFIQIVIKNETKFENI